MTDLRSISPACPRFGNRPSLPLPATVPYKGKLRTRVEHYSEEFRNVYDHFILGAQVAVPGGAVPRNATPLLSSLVDTLSFRQVAVCP